MEEYKVTLENWEYWRGVSPATAACRPSRQNGVHDGFDRRKQAVKMADVFGIEKVWAAIYEGSRQHGDFGSKKVTGHRIFLGDFIHEK